MKTAVGLMCAAVAVQLAFGAGVKPIGTGECRAGDLVVVFPPVELDAPVVEILGKEKSGRLFFATARTDGTKLK